MGLGLWSGDGECGLTVEALIAAGLCLVEFISIDPCFTMSLSSSLHIIRNQAHCKNIPSLLLYMKRLQSLEIEL
jgi:hypothetical protein